MIRDEPDEEPGPERPSVETLVAPLTAFEEWIETVGTVEAPQDVTLAAEVGGTLVRVAAEGQRVRRGEVVAEVEAGVARAAAAQARAAVADARAAARQTEDAVLRQQPLARDTIISPLEFEQAVAQRDQSLARLQQALAQEREAEERVEQFRLRAPFDATVEARMARGGEQVAAGQEVIRLIGGGALEITAGVPERYAGEIEQGAAARVGLNAAPGLEWGARVAFVGQAVDPQSRTFQIRIDVPEPPAALKAEMIARVRITRRVISEAVVLPLEAVTRDERSESVLIAEPLPVMAAAGNGAAAREVEASIRVVERRAVTVGPRSGEVVVIESGLAPGEEVVVLGLEEIAPGDTVRVTRRFPDAETYRLQAGAGAGAPR